MALQCSTIADARSTVNLFTNAARPPQELGLTSKPVDSGAAVGMRWHILMFGCSTPMPTRTAACPWRRSTANTKRRSAEFTSSVSAKLTMAVSHHSSLRARVDPVQLPPSSSSGWAPVLLTRGTSAMPQPWVGSAAGCLSLSCEPAFCACVVLARSPATYLPRKHIRLPL